MKLGLTLLAIFVLASPQAAAESSPGSALKAADKGQKNEEKKAEKDESAETFTILGRRWLKDAELVGSYGQPAWSTAKRFSKTRVYVLPAGSASFEYWLESKGKLEKDASAKFRSNYELEIGLGARLQLDLYLFTEQSADLAPLKLAGEQIELRWALADWGELWGNPALYLEWIRRHEAPQKIEAKILLGDAIDERLFWGFNFIYELELGGEAVQEYAACGGLSWSLIDGFLNLAAETKVALKDKSGARLDFSSVEWLMGPALQLRPLPGLHVDLVPLFGLEWAEGSTSPVYAVFFMLGRDFGFF